jgi:DNA-binding transcriptional ArsR family regulator
MPMPKKADKPQADEGRFAYEGLDRAMHEKGRLAIMTSLVTHPDGLLFNELKRLTSMTDGNLSRHLETLREANLIEVWKGFDGKRPQTLCRLTAEGRKRFAQYLAELEQVIQDAREREAELKKSAKGSAKLPPGWVPA